MSGKKILVADDSLTIQKVIRLALANEGYQIQAVSDGNDAIEQLSLFLPDVVLIDVSLPNQNAFEVKQSANEDPRFSKIKFVLMSSAFKQIDEGLSSRVKFDGRLVKPFDPTHLRQTLSEVIDASGKTEKVEPIISRSKSFESNSIPSADDFNQAHSSLPVYEPDEPKLSSDLWEGGASQDVGGGITLESPISPLANTALSSEVAPEEDIRKLTESTMKMSGMADFQWSIQEPVKKNPPKRQEPAFSMDDKEEMELDSRPEPKKVESRPTPPQRHLSEPAAPIAASASPFTPEQMEELVKKEVKALFEKMVQKTLPDVAEKVIKDEIHRILNDMR